MIVAIQKLQWLCKALCCGRTSLDLVLRNSLLRDSISDFVFKVDINMCEILSFYTFLLIINITNFRADLTDITARTETLETAPASQ